jgi:hypothetical protein
MVKFLSNCQRFEIMQAEHYSVITRAQGAGLLKEAIVRSVTSSIWQAGFEAGIRYQRLLTETPDGSQVN